MQTKAKITKKCKHAKRPMCTNEIHVNEARGNGSQEHEVFLTRCLDVRYTISLVTSCGDTYLLILLTVLPSNQDTLPSNDTVPNADCCAG